MTVETARSGPPQETQPGPLSARYLSFVAAVGLSSIGDAAWMIALASTVVGVAGPATAGAVLAIAGLPRIVTMLVGGALADRRGPARVMVGTDLGRCVVMLAAAVAVLVTGPSVPVLVAAAAGLTLLSAFFVPASGALRPLLLPEKDLVRGNSLYLVGLRAGQAAGGPVGAFLVGLGGVAAVAVANAASFVVSALAVSRFREKVPAKAAVAGPRFVTRVAEGFRHVARHRELRRLVLVVGLAELASAGPVNIGLVLVADGIGAGVTGAGLLLSAFTVGATAAFLWGLVRPVGRHAGPVAMASLLVQAAVLVTLGHVHATVAAIACYALLGLVSAQLGVVLVSQIQRATETSVRGRVMSIMSLVVFAAPPLGNAAIGGAIQWLGLTTTMVAHGVLALAAAAVYWSARALREARLD
ncbi:MAG: MFS transporter [Actinophytocola sp.]|uniref:MFS transporter n=1 Tax=Actinophytocola sp. TaxID=1872138 RepID=UPI003C765EB5